jgi:hypothetical protein
VRRTRLIALLCGTASLVIAGCSSPPESAPAASTQPPGGDQANIGQNNTTPSAPPVENPLDVSEVEADPCSGLTPTQLEPYLGAIHNSTKKVTRNGTVCSFHPVDLNKQGIGFLVFPDIGGPAGMFRGTFPFKERAGAIAGYPAVHQAQTPDGPRRGECETVVAVSDRAAIAVYPKTITESDPNYKNMCVVSDRLAELAIANLKTGG